MMKQIFSLCCLAILLAACSSTPGTQEEPNDDSFTFTFLTDIHIQPELRATEGFQMAIDSVNAIAPDFVITGGDLVYDVLNASHERADSLYNLYKEMTKGFNMPVYNTMGNHEIYGYASSEADPQHSEYGEKMYENRIGKRYYSFDHKGWHFMILDGIEKGEANGGAYIGKVDSTQLTWIKKELEQLDPETPIVLATHIPLVSIFPQILHGPLYADNQGSLVTNQQQVLALFRKMNLKLVLQGHLHAVEELNLMGQVRFITGGAVSGLWWKTPDDG
ncbi:MAG: metallophosphoesterase, partial [Bacteroidota bacterium]